jgi:hypothetical protein
MKSIKKIILRTFLGLFIVLVLFIGLLVVPYFANIVMPWQRADAIDAALEWGDLAELPDNADDISVDTEGSMFTREFIVEFTSDKKTIEEWILKSNGLRTADFHKGDDGVVSYQVDGHEGSIGGTVTIDKGNGRVIIDMSWS